MTELQAMQEQIEQLKQETQALKIKGKAQMVRQRFIFGLTIAAIGLGLVARPGVTQGEAKSVVCKRLQVVDDANRVVLSPGSTKDGEGLINIYNGFDKSVVVLSATTDTGDGKIWLNDQKGKPMATIGSDGAGTGVVWTKKGE